MGDGGSSTMETRCGQRQLDDEVKPYPIYLLAALR
jgi:hypothetical protein